MEWGIKLKNELTKRLFKKFLIKLLIITILIPLTFFLLAFVISMIDFQWLYDFSPTVYYNINLLFQFLFGGVNLFIIMFLIWLVLFIIFFYKYLKEIFTLMDALIDAADKLVDKNIDYISLPNDLALFEKKLNKYKRESEKMAQLAKENEQKKDELIVYLAHDIKTPLTSMIGYLSILDEIDDMPKKQQQKYIKIALDKSYRLEDLINELFDIARFNSEKIVLVKEELNLNLMIEQIIDDFYPVLKELNKKINFTYTKTVMINGDPDKLGRVFTNLIKNAINYSQDESDITITLNKDENTVNVAIINKGKQIPKEKLAKIFEKFYRADTSRNTKTGGSGLGLAIAKEIIELHKGKIEAESTEEETTFKVSLPL